MNCLLQSLSRPRNAPLYALLWRFGVSDHAWSIAERLSLQTRAAVAAPDARNDAAARLQAVQADRNLGGKTAPSVKKVP